MGEDGEKDAAEIGEEIEQPDFEGKSKGTKVIDQSSLEKAFSTPEGSDPLKTLLTPGNSLIHLAMKAAIPSKAWVWALSSVDRKLDKHNNTRGRKQMLVVMAGHAGVKQARADMIIDGYIGEKRNTSGRGIGEWIREKAGLGAGEKE